MTEDRLGNNRRGTKKSGSSRSAGADTQQSCPGAYLGLLGTYVLPAEAQAHEGVDYSYSLSLDERPHSIKSEQCSM